MRLLELGKFFPPVRGGIETHLAMLARYLRDDVDLEIVAFNDRLSLFSRRERWEGVPVLRVACHGKPFSTPLSLSLPLALARKRWDILHLHLPNPFASALCLMPWVPGKLAVTWHSDVVRQRRLARLVRPVMVKLLAKASVIIVSSAAVARHSPLLGPFRKKCAVIPYGVEAEAFAETKGSLRRKAELAERIEKPLVLFVGRLVYYKGLDVLIRAMEGLDADLAIIGKGPLEGSLRRLASRGAAPERVRFLGEVDDETLLSAYHLCDLLCLPSVARSEAFGIVQLEAMACGKPVVSTDLPTAVPEVNVDGVTGLVVPPADEGALRQALLTLLQDPALRAKFGAHGRARVLNVYPARRMARATLEVLLDATHGKIPNGTTERDMGIGPETAPPGNHRGV